MIRIQTCVDQRGNQDVRGRHASGALPKDSFYQRHENTQINKKEDFKYKI